MNKKLIFIFLLLFSFIIEIKAYSFKSGDLIDGVYVLKIDESGVKEYKKGRFIIDDDGNYVYCLEPFVRIKKGETYNEYEIDFAKKLGISEELWQKVNLINYYGYEYKDDTHNHTDSKWYYITQMLIWQNVSPNSRFYFTDTFEGEINSSLYVNEIKEIYDLVNNHFVIPEFDIPDVFINDTITIIDKNGVLNKFKSTDVKINGNLLTIKINNEDNSFTLTKSSNTKGYIYVSDNSQNILKGKMDIPVRASYNIKGKYITGNIKLKKYGEFFNQGDYKKNPLANITFTIYDENNNLLKEETTNEYGELTFTNLHPGKYFIKETNTNDNYILDDKMYEVNLSINENNRVIDVFLEPENYLKKGNLIIKKTDFDNNTLIKDTKFIIMKDKEVIYEGLTNEEGILELDNLPLGIYEIKEVAASTGYVLNELIYEVNLEQENEDTLIEIKNELEKGNLIIKKTDFDNNTPIKDTKFIIMKDKEIIYEGLTNEEGILKVDNLPLGTYEIKEVMASTGYVLSELIYEVKLEKRNEDTLIEIKNELEKGKLIIKKIDANNYEALKETEFIITKDGKIIYQGTTNEEGILELDNLPFGKYIVKEIKASTGYIINEEEIDVSIDTDVKYIEIKNIPNTNINTQEIILYIERKRKI